MHPHVVGGPSVRSNVWRTYVCLKVTSPTPDFDYAGLFDVANLCEVVAVGAQQLHDPAVAVRYGVL